MLLKLNKNLYKPKINTNIYNVNDYGFINKLPKYNISIRNIFGIM